ncbi:MAG: SIS domain-containing protein [Actinomycetota bacterium]|nr:SIS domain-containing protein [Actinomycetota bacterium]
MTGTHSLLSYRLAGRISQREAILTAFLSAEQDRIVNAGLDMARAFERGGKLIAFGTGSAEADAHRIAAELRHPASPEQRALPAVALGHAPDDAARLTALAGPHDIALGLTHSHWTPGTEAFLTTAEALGLLGVACGAAASSPSRSLAYSLDHALIVPSDDPFVAQEVQTTIHHVLWELIQVFFEHLDWREDRCVSGGDLAFTGRVIALSNGVATIETRGFTEEVAVDRIDRIAVDDLLLCHAGVALRNLSFVRVPPAHEPASLPLPLPGGGDGRLGPAFAIVRDSMLRAGEEASALRRGIDLSALERCAATVRDRLHRGGRVITFGSPCASAGALDVWTDFVGYGWPALSLTRDPATTGDADGAGEAILAERLRSFGQGEDIALAIITSSASVDVLAALEEARTRRLLTCVIAGNDGSGLAECDWIDHLFTVSSDSTARIQEVLATIHHLLLETIGER